MSRQLERARLLYEQNRFTEALAAVAPQLASNPEDCEARLLMALCLSSLGKHREAIKESKRAVAREPLWPYAYYVSAHVLFYAGQPKKAQAAARQALQLDPEDFETLALMATMSQILGHWQEALRYADQALAIEPEHIGASGVRAQALSILGRKDEARATARRTIKSDPDSSYAHCCAGYTLLNQGRHKESLIHFREALRLDPNDDSAREGLLHALRSRFAPYRWVIAWNAMTQRLPGNARWVYLIALYVLVRTLAELSKTNPHLVPFAIPIVGAYCVFVLFSWVGEPLINIVLLMHPVGRYALLKPQRWACYWIIALMASATIMFSLGPIWGSRMVEAAFLPVLGFVLVTLATHVKSAPKLQIGMVHVFGGLCFFGGLAAGLSVILS